PKTTLACDLPRISAMRLEFEDSCQTGTSFQSDKAPEASLQRHRQKLPNVVRRDLQDGYAPPEERRSRCDESLTDVKGGSATLGEEETQLTRSHDMHLPADSHTVDALPGLAWSD
ncbi:unnamed protein product, partial [Effrenium voratum]